MKRTLLGTAATLILGAVGVLSLPPRPASAEDAPAGLFDRDTLTGDWGGVRTKLIDSGVTLGVKYTGELWAVPSGGVHRGVDYEDQFLGTADIDFEKLAGWTGGLGHVSAFSMQGRGPSFNDVGNAMDVSGIEYLGKHQRSTRLWTLWYQQTMLDGMVSLRAGQLSVDDEFMVSSTAGGLINTTFGYNALGFANLPAGVPNNQGLTNGPAYPLGAPGARLTVTPRDDVAWLTGVFTHQPESIDRGGAQFRFDGDAFVISELQYLVNQAKDATGLPAMFKLGGWYDTGNFADPHYDTLGRSLALAGTNGIPRQHSGEWALYALADQTVWQGSDGRAVSLFLRGGLAPSSYAIVNSYVDFGAGYKGLIPGRESDTLTFGMAYAGVGDGIRGFDNDVRRVSGLATPVRNYEIALELSYLAQLAPWWTLQPDFQYIVHPGYGAVNVNLNTNPTLNPTKAIDDAVVLGVRTTITF